MFKEEKAVKPRFNTAKIIIFTLIGVFLFFFILLPLGFVYLIGSFSSSSSGIVGSGNVALIPIEGVIMTEEGSSFNEQIVSSKQIVEYIEDADTNSQVEAIVLEINSPGGSAVASDEIATAVKKVKKPIVAMIREVGASGGYWVASSTDYIIAHRMAITGSIGVISSYLEFSGLMEDYGVGYERLVAGKYKDMSTPFRELGNEERDLLQSKLDVIHEYFIQEVAENRKLSINRVRQAATGEFYLGVEALKLGLIDEVGDKGTVELYLKEKHNIEEPMYITYKRKSGFFEILSGVFNEFFFYLGKGISSRFVPPVNKVMVV